MNPQIGPLESTVLGTLWDGGALTVRQVINSLGSDHAYTTIATVLRNLSHKNLVSIERDPERNCTRYRARVTCCDLVARRMLGALQESRNRQESLESFVTSLNAEDQAALKRAVALVGD